MRPSTHLEAEHKDRLRELGQERILAWLEQLDPEPAARLASELAGLDLDLLQEHRSLVAGARGSQGLPEFEPPELFPLEPAGRRAAEAGQARARGLELLGEGQVGFLLVAGGQASRLGYDGPKGTFPVGPVSGFSLFEYHARRLLKVKRRHGKDVVWYVMTSPANHVQTQEFFEAHSWFGLDAEHVRLFPQSMRPALDTEGRLVLAGPERLFTAPDGHGGTLSALHSSGCLAHARDMGLTQLSYFQVDNPLALPADPLFLGLHDRASADMSSKVVAKRDAGEKVGIIGRVDGVLGCIEYSDLPAALRDQRDDEGQLVFRAGNIAAHVLRTGFIEELTSGALRLPWHLARKKLKAFDPERGTLAEVAGIKFETFVFDALGRAKQSVTLEVHRAHEFSPVKNAAGSDSPETTRRDLCALHAGWIQVAGLRLPPADSSGHHAVEVDPVLAESQDEFQALPRTAPEVSEDGHLYRG